MNIAVCVKHAIDEGELRADSSGRPQLQGALAKMSTFDRNAVEEAVQAQGVKGGLGDGAVSLGSQDWKKTMKEALAMGCDRAVAISSAAELDTLATSYYLSRALQKAGPFDIVFLSEGASDTYDGLVGPMVAEWLGIPFIGYARKVELGAGTVKARGGARRKAEVELEASLPAGGIRGERGQHAAVPDAAPDHAGLEEAHGGPQRSNR